MKEKIEIIVKFGVPITVLLIFVFAMFFASDGGGAYGLGGLNVKLILSLALFIALYLIAGIIVWAVSKNNFIIISAVFSVAVILVFYMIFAVFTQAKKSNHDKENTEKFKKEKIKIQQKYDSLFLVAEKSNNDNKAMEECALFFFNEICNNNSPKAKIEKHKKDLELLVENKSINKEIYTTLAWLYNLKYEYEKSENLLEKALETIKFSEEDKKAIQEYLQKTKKEHKNYKSAIKRYKEEIKNLTKKEKSETLNDKELTARGRAYWGVSKPNKAIEDFNKALKLNPKNTEALSYKAACLADIKRYSEAIKIYEYFKKIFPNSKKIYQKKINKIKAKMEADKKQ